MPITSLKFITRHLWHNRLYSSIKIAGLTIGMACMLLAILFVRDENSYDRFHEKASRLYRITTRINNPATGERDIMGSTGQVQGPAFAAGIPEIQQYVRIMAGLNTNFIGNQQPLSLNYLYADEKFFDVFSFPLLYGNASTALKELNSVVITEQTAQRFFGRTDVVGKTIKLEEGQGTVTFLITGVARNIPTHSSIQFEAVLPFAYLQTMFHDDNWLNPYLSTFVLLDPRADANRVKNKFAQIFRSAAGNQLQAAKMRPGQINYGLQPITDVHLNIFEKGSHSVIGSGNLEASSVATYSYLLMGIAAFILVMACVNFLSLSIAGSLKRSKEIGVRKISGASSGQIVRQFLLESTVLCSISFILSVVLVSFGLPVFNRLAQKQIELNFFADILFFIYGLILMGCCILIVGLYPAIKLSFFNAAVILYKKQKTNGKNIFSKSLIVLQFTLAIILVMGTIIYYRQMNFISRNDLGYNASNMVKIHLPTYRNVNGQALHVLRARLIAEPAIVQMANGDMSPREGFDLYINGGSIKVGQSNIDQYFIPGMDIRLVEGRNFSGDFKSDSSQSVIVNETFIKEAAIKDPVGQQITLTDGGHINHAKTIIGVVKDFHYASLKEKINPLVFVMNQSEYIWVKLEEGKTPAALAKIKSVFKTTFPDYFYQYAFMDEEVKNQYGNEQRWKQIIGYTSLLAIIICCIGLFGLAHFATLSRIKEIGIRKVLGASELNISRLLSQDFIKLVFLAILIASPVAWYAMHSWLQNFIYRITISWTDFMLAAVVALMIALITVSSQALKAAAANPVESLKME